jgi:signal transduction histidine kinase
VAYGSNLPFVVATLLAFAAVLNLPGQSLDQALADLAFTLLVLLLAGGAGSAVRSVRARAEASAAREVALEAERTRAAEEAAGAERQRIHREMHDILSHSLAVIVLQSGAAEQALERDPQRACEAIRSARTTAQEALSQLHILLRVIRAEPDGWRDPTPDLDRLRHLAKQATAAGFPVELTTEGRPAPVPATVQTSLYRVAQEGLANSMKHSGAAGCQIVLRYLPDTVEVEVLDRGTGHQQGNGARVGLAGIQERASVFGGHVDSGPRVDGGWSLRVAIPLPA